MSFTHGGQIGVQKAVMFGQVLKISIWLVLILAILFVIPRIYFSIPLHRIVHMKEYYIAKSHAMFLDKEKIIQLRDKNDILHTPKGSKPKMVSAYYILVEKPYFRKNVENIKRTLKNILLYETGPISIGSWIITSAGFFLYGRSKRREKYVKGMKLVSAKVFNKLARKKAKGNGLKLGDVVLPNNIETRHMLISGTTGSGKTNCMFEVLKQIRERGEKAVIVDTNGQMIRRFFNPNQDRILNPFDTRGKEWNFWNECEGVEDISNIAAAMVPDEKYSSPFWALSARTLFEVLLEKKMQEKDNDKLHKLLFHGDMKDLLDLIAETEAGALIAKGNPETTGSIRANLLSRTKIVKYLSRYAGDFSIKKWLKEDDNGWLFLSSKPEQRNIMRPLLTCWVDTAINTVMSLGEDNKEKKWIIIDELPSLNKIPSLSTGLAELRKYNGCILSTIQNRFQLDDIYGQGYTNNMLGNYNTKIFFAASDAANARWASDEIGTSKTIQYTENNSYGTDSVRDSVSSSAQQKSNKIVSETDITMLEPLNAYVSIAGFGNTVKAKFEYHEMEKVAEAFIQKTFEIKEEKRDIEEDIEEEKKWNNSLKVEDKKMEKREELSIEGEIEESI